MPRRLLLVILFLAACGSKEKPGTLDPGKLVPEHDTVDVGAVLVGESATTRIRFQNRGRVEGALQASVAAPFRIASTTPASLAPGDVATVEVVFEPKDRGPAAANLEAKIDGVGDAVQVRISGEGDVPELQVDAAIDFGEVPIGTTAHGMGRITSKTGAPLTVTLELTGDDGGAYGLPVRRLHLAPSASVDVEATFTPGSEGASAASLKLKACDACEAVTMPLSGRGVGPKVLAGPTRLDFGHVRPGASARQVITVSRDGATPAWLTAVELVAGETAPFTLEAPALPLELGATAVEIPVTFAPTDRVASSGVVHLVAGGQIFDVELDGDGGDGGLSIFPSALDFGWVPAGSTTLSFSISDRGTGLPLTITSAHVEGSPVFAARSSRGMPTTARGSDLKVEITLTATQPGSYQAELVLEIEGEPPRRAPITATVVSGGFCDLEVDGSLRIGLATVGKGLERTLRLRNNASDDCMVSEVQIAGAPSFTLPGVTKSRVFLVPARGVQPITVRFDPTAAGLSVETATLTLRKTDLETPYTTIQVSGQGTDIDLSTAPGEVIFPASPVGSEGLVAVDVQNHGRAPVQLSSTMAGPTSLSIEGKGPELVAGESSATLVVRFHPLDIVRVTGELQIFTPTASEPWVIPVTGQVSSDACGATCTRPVVACPAARSVFLEEVAQLSGAARHPAGTPLTCTWTVVKAPNGSTAAPTAGCATLFQPDVAGTYDLELNAAGDGSATCRTTLTASAAGGLWVSAQPGKPDDLDLHLFDESAGPLDQVASWRTGGSDCWRRRPAPDWGTPAASPVYQAGDGVRPEVVRVASPAVGTSYRVGAHWPSTRSGNASLTVDTAIWCGGAVAARVSTTLDQPYQAAELGTVTFTARDTCTFTPSSTRVVVLP
jgi:hypothetical protein